MNPSLALVPETLFKPIRRTLSRTKSYEFTLYSLHLKVRLFSLAKKRKKERKKEEVKILF